MHDVASDRLVVGNESRYQRLMATSSAEKDKKRRARQLRDQARSAFEAGDYHQARAFDAEVVALVGKSELGAQAFREAEQLRVDRGGIYAGLGAGALYVLAWIFALA